MKRINFISRIPAPLSIVFTWILIGTFAMHQLEDWTWTQCFYYAVITLTTVGYGDFVPSNDSSRLFVAFYVLIGVTITIGALGYIGTQYLERKRIIHSSRK